MVTHSRAPVRVDRLRALNLPRPVTVEVDHRGHPKTIKDSQCRRVEAVGEIWRVDDEWWREPISRRYVEVMLEGGGHVVLFEDLTTAQWFLQMP
jgi:hypothetical protein